MEDSILFREEPIETKKGKRSKIRNDRSRLKLLASSEKEQFEKDLFSSGGDNQQGNNFSGIDLLADYKIPTVSPKKPRPIIVEKKLTAQEYANQNPVVKRYIFTTTPCDYTITKEELIIRIAESVEKTYSFIDTLFKTTISRANKDIDAKRKKLQEKIDKILKNTQMDFQKKATKVLYLDIDVELANLEEKNIQHISDSLVKCIDYAKILHEENPTVDIKINTPQIENDIKNFPDEDQSYNLLLKRRNTLKKHFHKIKSKDGMRSIHLTLLLLCRVNKYEPQFNYFFDEGKNMLTFQQVLSKLPNDFQKKIESRIEQSIKSPKTAGRLIVACSQELCEMKKINFDKFLHFIFLYFSRHFFNQIYTMSLFEKVLPSKSREFTQRVQRLRNIPPIGFGFAQRYLIPTFTSLRLKDFPTTHMYSDACQLFIDSSFEMNPIDFCRIIFEAFQKIQKVASNFDFETRQKLTGQLFAKSESLLSFDDLFDISLIVFLLAGVGDTFVLVESFYPYVYGLGLPSEFEFTFTNLHEICEQIAKMDIDKFMDDAMERTSKDLEKEPLMIANYVGKKD